MAVDGEEKEREKLQVKGNLRFKSSHTFQSELTIKQMVHSSSSKQTINMEELIDFWANHNTRGTEFKCCVK